MVTYLPPARCKRDVDWDSVSGDEVGVNLLLFNFIIKELIIGAPILIELIFFVVIFVFPVSLI